MVAIAVSLLFGIAAFASLLVIRRSVERAFAAQQAIRAELAELDCALSRQRLVTGTVRQPVRRRAAWSRPAVRPVAWLPAPTPCAAA